LRQVTDAARAAYLNELRALVLSAAPDSRRWKTAEPLENRWR
jgi:hypothetical protein